MTPVVRLGNLAVCWEHDPHGDNPRGVAIEQRSDANTAGPNPLASAGPPVLTTGDNPRGLAIEQRSDPSIGNARARTRADRVADAVIAAALRLFQTGVINVRQARAFEARMVLAPGDPGWLVCSGVFSGGDGPRDRKLGRPAKR